MVIENLQSEQNYDDKSPNGYGLLFLDYFEPADSELTFTIRDAITGQIATDGNGNDFKDMRGPVIELWDLDATAYPYIDLEVNFNSGSNQLSTPIFYGYSFGTEMGLTFNDLKRVRGLDVDDGTFDYVHENGITIYINSSTFLDSAYEEFSKPIYGMNVTGIKTCLTSIELYSPMHPSPFILDIDVDTLLDIPIFEFDLKFVFTDSCVITDIWIDLMFGHHMEGIEVDFWR